MIITWVRLLAIGCSGASLGMGSVILARYIHAPSGTTGKLRVILLGLSYQTWVVGGIWRILEKVLNSQPWEFHTTPLAFVASLLGVMGFIRMIDGRRNPKAFA